MILALIVVSITTAYIVGSAISVLYLARRDMAQNNHEEGVSVLKPLCGADDDLECNLRAFFEQDHQRFELVFMATRRT